MAITSRPNQPLVRILVVEDEPKLRDTLVEGLRLEEWNVTGAGSEAEAWQHLGAQDFDLIVLDWMLPDGNGLDLVCRLRDRQKNTPVLMISARGGATARETALAAGATGYLAKPFAFADLVHASRALLRVTV